MQQKLNWSLFYVTPHTQNTTRYEVALPDIDLVRRAGTSSLQGSWQQQGSGPPLVR